ncbi:LysR family transcriptional regulator [Brevibacterium sp. CFH 10365]|uniref:LysR family transcriptional regulator n=1 Tax=Brevibacterium sp. CFH 10365 TaxID=2585207 RepID=UPI00126680DA|nr:LysR family transcriptional regulator [Brevibacterium sp. CFH 10365]
MTLSQLRAFLAAWEFGTFTAAAEELEVSQASVSELVVRLETELGVQLFVRGSRRLKPTSAATELRTHAESALGAVEAATHSMRSLNSLESGEATFGVPRNANHYGLSDLVLTFHTRHPGVRIRMVGLNSEEVARMVRDGQIEAGLVVLPIRDTELDVEPLFADRVLYATTRREKNAGPVEIDDIIADDLVLYDAHSGWDDPTRRQLWDRAQGEGVRPQPTIEVEHVESALSLVAAGVGGTLVSASLVRNRRLPKGVRTFEFAEPFEETLALIKREGSGLSLATKTIVELVRETIAPPTGAKRIRSGSMGQSASTVQTEAR